MRLTASITFGMLFLASNSVGSATTPVENILEVCHTSTNGSGCKDLDKKTISVRGYLDNGGYYNKPVLVPNAEIIQNYDADSLENIYGIAFLVSETTRKNYTPYLGKNVIITGEIITDCVPKSIEADKFNKTQMSEIDEKSEFKIFIRKLSRKCSSNTNPYMIEVEIVEDKS